MKSEIKTLKYSMINNLLIAIIKVVGGLFFHLGSLFADGLHTFSDFITDIVSMVGARITKKRPTKIHPAGFGQVEYLTNIFVGFLLFMLALFIIISAFFKESIIPPLTVLYLLAVTFILKFIAILVMNKIGKKIHSNVLLTSVSESKTDLYSTIGVIIITILLQFSKYIPILKYVDLIGSIIIGLIVLKTSLEIIISNSLSIIGEAEINDEIISELQKFLTKFKKINNSHIVLFKYGPYYKLQLTLELARGLSLNQAERLITKIRRDIILQRHFKIKYHIMETALITDNAQIAAADYNDDGQISPLDYVKVKNYIMNEN